MYIVRDHGHARSIADETGADLDVAQSVASISSFIQGAIYSQSGLPHWNPTTKLAWRPHADCCTYAPRSSLCETFWPPTPVDSIDACWPRATRV